MACNPMRGPDGRPVGFICGPAGRPRCTDQAGCSLLAVRLCDWVKPDGTTCDRGLCDFHAKTVLGGKEFCPEHHEEYKAIVDRYWRMNVARFFE